jgi:hypothetical protein
MSSNASTTKASQNNAPKRAEPESAEAYSLVFPNFIGATGGDICDDRVHATITKPVIVTSQDRAELEALRLEAGRVIAQRKYIREHIKKSYEDKKTEAAALLARDRKRKGHPAPEKGELPEQFKRDYESEGINEEEAWKLWDEKNKRVKVEKLKTGEDLVGLEDSLAVYLETDVFIMPYVTSRTLSIQRAKELIEDGKKDPEKFMKECFGPSVEGVDYPDAESDGEDEEEEEGEEEEEEEEEEDE